MINSKEWLFKSVDNYQDIKAQQYCQCYSCCQTIWYEWVVSFVDNGSTALCPVCGIDSLIAGDAYSEDELKSFYKLAFGGSK